MSNPSGRKGSAWELASKRWLIEEGIEAHDQKTHGAFDLGDLEVPKVTLECKNDKSYALATWVGELEAERLNNGHDYAFILAHRKGKAHPRDAYVITTGRLWIPVLKLILARG